MSKLKQAVTSMEETRGAATVDHLKALRHWRLAAERRFMTVVVKAAELKPAKKGRGK